MSEITSYISDNEKLSIRHQCQLLGISRSSFYYDPVGESEENLRIMRLMDQEHLDHPTHGVLQMQDFLSGQNLNVNHKRIRRLLRLMGIMAIYPKRNLSKLGYAKYIRPYLLRGLEIDRPNQVWAIDITYIPMAKGFMYLVAIIDVYSRMVVGWDVFNSLNAENPLMVLKRAIAQYGKPEIINSDQGSQFTCALWTEFVEGSDIKISMDGKGAWRDNVFVERIWRTIKYDEVYIRAYDSVSDARASIGRFIAFRASCREGVVRPEGCPECDNHRQRFHL